MVKDVIIKRFQIKKLFGLYNVDIPFENYLNIFVGENGLGKTTILNCLNYVLQCDVDNLYNTDFDEIIITFKNEKNINIKHDELIPIYKIDRMRLRYSNIHLEEYQNIAYNYLMDCYFKLQISCPHLSKDQLKDELMNAARHSSLYINYKDIEEIIKDIEKNKKNDWRYKIKNELENNVIYLPTYRRIEEDFNKFISNDIKKDDYISKKISNLQFGMDDVVKLIDKTCEQLKNATNEGFKEMTGNLLKNYFAILNNSNNFNSDLKDNIDEDKLRIVFERLADKIDENVKKQIIELIGNKNTNDAHSKFFLSIINNLLEIYEKTRETDESLFEFAEVCNIYFEKNRFIYNPYEITCELRQKENNKKLEYKYLSSGEKQIVSLFSKLYLSKFSNNIILFDEPELSLSIKWQSMIIPHIVNTQKCDFIMVITHSPFIFDNEFKQYTKDIKEFITPISSRNE